MQKLFPFPESSPTMTPYWPSRTKAIQALAAVLPPLLTVRELDLTVLDSLTFGNGGTTVETRDKPLLELDPFAERTPRFAIAPALSAAPVPPLEIGTASSTSVARPKFVRACLALVAPVPPFATGTASTASVARPRFVRACLAVVDPVPPAATGTASPEGICLCRPETRTSGSRPAIRAPRSRSRRSPARWRYERDPGADRSCRTARYRWRRAA
ncbi:hypothetical protein EC839_101252 [Pseudomonas sp. JUb52]|nr:hypothetical protein EC839_101252 [Pseudomonas sp. JUb52]